MSPEVEQMGTLLKAPSPYYSKMELFRSSWRHSIGRKKSYIIITNGHSKGASGGLKVGAIPSAIGR